MQIIPVLDLHKGDVVHARHGQREKYQKVKSILCHGSEPLVITRALLDLYSFNTIYIADIDAISAEENNHDIVRTLLSSYPDTRFWLDSGKHTLADAGQYPNLRRVIGTENQLSQEELQCSYAEEEVVLSLDFSAEHLLGKHEILDNPACWPAEVIVMSLAKVGSESGPDMKRLEHIIRQAEDKKVYAAGGVRGPDDIRALGNAGCQGALIATSLHLGTLTGALLQGLATGT